MKKIILFTITTLLLLFNCNDYNSGTNVPNEPPIPCEDGVCLLEKQLNFFKEYLEDDTLTKQQLFNIKTMSLSSQSISTLPIGIFDNLTNLTRVDLTDNPICSVDKSDVGLTDRVTLNFEIGQCLTDEQVTFFSRHIMSITTKKELYEAPTLDLQSKSITSLEAGIFNNLTSLTSVDLTDNDICIVDKADVGLADRVTLNFDVWGCLTDDQLTFFSSHISSLDTKKKLYDETTLDLSNKSITSLDTGIFDNLTNLTSVNLTGNYTCIVDKADVGLADSVNLTLPPLNEDCLTDAQLTFFSSHISSITTKQELYEETVLVLQSKSISTLPTGIFNNLTNLRELDFFDNNLTSLPDGIFDNLTSLTELDFFDNNLTSLPDGIFDNLTSLTELDLSQNNLTSLPDGIFDNLTSLTELYLSQNNLTSLPDGIDKLTSLRELSLSTNALTSLPDGIDKLTSLTTLRSDNNQLTSIPDGIDKLTSLTTLRSDNNQLTSIPDGIDKLTSLSELSLSTNALTSLPDGIDKLTSLTTLLLDNNDFTSFPDGIDKLTSLRALFLDNNDLASLPDGIFNNLTSLIILQLKRSVDTNSFDCNDTNYTAWGLDLMSLPTSFTCN